jgi:hypothetical protein
MVKTPVNRFLVFGVIVLFLGISSTTLGFNVNNNENKLRDNSEILGTDDYLEIFTRVDGYGYSMKWGRCIFPFYFNIKMYDISNRRIEIWGLRFPGGDSLYFHENVGYLEARLFIGFAIADPGVWAIANGIIFGNIKWE